MIPVLESPDIRSRALPISVETYHWMITHGMVPQRAELIRGVIVEKMSKSSLHEYLAGEIFGQLAAACHGGWLVRKEGPITLLDSEPEPDVSVVAGQRSDYLESHPRTALLLVEVAVTTEAADREMVKAYGEARVPETWLVLATKRMIEIYTRPDQGVYQECRIVEAGQMLISSSLAGVEIDTKTIFPAL